MTDRITSATESDDLLPVEQVWMVYCSRCANEGTSGAESASGARAEFLMRGWSREYPRTYCPPCNGDLRTPPASTDGGS